MIIAMYGAAGHTGRFVVAEALRRGHQPIAIGRDAGALADAAARWATPVETRVAGLHADNLDRALADAGVLVNCAGPFLDSAEPLIDAALRAGIHYLDITAEQASAAATLATYNDAARERGIVIAPAVGFYGGLGDIVVTAAMGAWPYADRIDIAIALDRWWPTRGTRRTGDRNTATRVVIRDGTLTPVGSATVPPWNFPEPFGTQEVAEVPLSETILIAHHVRVSTLRNVITSASLRDISDPATPEPVSTDQRGRSSQRFLVDVIVRQGDDARRVTVRGQDIYAITAPIVLEAVERIVRRSDGGGTFAVGQLVDARDMLRALVERGELASTTTDLTAADLTHTVGPVSPRLRSRAPCL